MPRKTAPTTDANVLANAAQLNSFIEAAANHKGDHPAIVAIPGAAANLKGVTDKIRRMPRIKGWSALSVKVTETTDTTATLVVTNAGTDAVAWPTRETAKKVTAKKATAKKATAKKATAKKATPAKSAAAPVVETMAG